MIRDNIGLFRGKLNGSGAWVEGYFSLQPSSVGTNFAYIATIPKKNSDGELEQLTAPVLISTVGEATGVVDINGKMLYEGDVVQNIYAEKFVIKFLTDKNFASFCIVDEENNAYDMDEYDKYVIIGNIYDDPELFKEVKTT